MTDPANSEDVAGRPTSRASRRQREAVEKAAQLFDSQGYHATSMEDIAAAVGLRKPSLYHYFRAKEELLLSIHDSFIDPLTEQMERRRDTRMTAQQHLLEIFGDILALNDSQQGHTRVFHEHFRDLPSEYQTVIAQKRDHYFDLVEEVIQRGIDEGSIRPMNTRLATFALFGLAGWAYKWYRADGPLRTRELAYFFWEIFVHGVAAPSPSPRPPAE